MVAIKKQVPLGTTASVGPTLVVGGILANLPNNRVRAESGKWHWAFMKLRERHRDDVPELAELEFSRRPGVWPISERLERIFQVIDMAGTGSTLNPTLVVRQFSGPQKARLRKVLGDSLGDRKGKLSVLGQELQKLLEDAPSIPPGE
jgi:hypothetical protein